jgi:hypothetical protein
MNNKIKLGIMQSLSRTEMKKVLGGDASEQEIGSGAVCSDSNCQKKDDGTRKTCPSGCKCDSAEGNPCY